MKRAKKSKIFGFILFLFFLPILLLTDLLPEDENIRFKRVNREQGLSQSTVTCMLQDHIGYLWIGTLDGLNKYGGYGFSIYRNDPLEPSSISDNEIIAMMEQSTGDLWLSTYGGWLNLYDREKNIFHRFKVSEDRQEKKILIFSMIEDKSQTIWLGTNDLGLFWVRGDTSEPSRIIFGGPYQHDKNDPQSLSSNYIRTLYEDGSGNIWMTESVEVLKMLYENLGEFIEEAEKGKEEWDKLGK